MKETKTILLAAMLGKDIRTRSRVKSILDEIDPLRDTLIDLRDVEFISRSFADELITLMEMNESLIKIANASDEVEAMIGIVKRGRNKAATSVAANGKVKKLTDMDAVKAFFTE